MDKIRFKKTIEIPQKGYMVKCASSEHITPLDCLMTIFDKEDVKEISVIQQAGGGGYYRSMKSFFDKHNFTNVKFYMSDFIIKMSKGTLSTIETFNAPILFGTNHLKTILIKTENNNYMINSSGALDSKSKIEYIEITNNINTYNFFKEFISKNFK